MSRPLKKRIKNNGLIKANKKARKFRNKSGRVLLRVFVLLLVFFIGIAVNSTIIPEYPSLAQTGLAPYIPSFLFWS